MQFRPPYVKKWLSQSVVRDWLVSKGLDPDMVYDANQALDAQTDERVTAILYDDPDSPYTGRLFVIREPTPKLEYLRKGLG